MITNISFNGMETTERLCAYCDISSVILHPLFCFDVCASSAVSLLDILAFESRLIFERSKWNSLSSLVIVEQSL